MALASFGELIPSDGGARIPLTKHTVTIGRSAENDLPLKFSNVSSQHCRLVMSDGYWYVQDLNSSNGVKLNGSKVRDHRVDPGAKIAVANHEFTLHYSPKALGASGEPPREILDEAAFFGTSLMQKAGLAGSPKKTSHEEREPEVFEISPQKETATAPQEKKSYFEDLPF